MKSKIKVSFMVFLDLLIVYASYIFGIFLRFDGVLGPDFYAYYGNLKARLLFPILVVYFISFIAFRVYSVMIIHVGLGDILKIFASAGFATGIIILYADYVNKTITNLLPLSVYFIALMLIFIFTAFVRTSYRIVKGFEYKLYSERDSRNRKRVLIYGAGEGGISLLKAFQKEDQKKDKRFIVAFYDDDIVKEKKRISGLPIYGAKTDLVELCERLAIDEIIIAIPSATAAQMAKMVEKCKMTNCRLLKIPNLIELMDYNNITVGKVQEVSISDLLGRKEADIDIESISQYLSDEVVLVTGGGGSIGSELCRQIMKFTPAKLVIFDIYENNAYDINNEMVREYGPENIDVVIGSVRDVDRLEEVFEKYRPGVVFHAAAHKHVPLMEASPKEAVKNNVFGTYNVAVTADKFNVKKFVLISTDKAVNPTNVMGATKRLAEMVVMSINSRSKTEFVAVRFGNVLGSNGSVIPLFKKQIQNGGPVTVTDPKVVRYFMTIPEAAKLVIQTGSMAKGGEIFILDMGEPVKILNLAEDLIKLSGLVPYRDIDIVFTGMRPGEKLYEELMQSEEGTTESSKEGIFIAKPTNISSDQLMNMLEELKSSIDNNKNIIDFIKEFVPTYNPAEERLS